MALQKQQPRVNRYKKKGGRGGGFVFAAFVLLAVILVAGGYFLKQFGASDTTEAPVTTVYQPVVAPPQPVQPQLPHSSAKIPDARPTGTTIPVKHYFDADTPLEEKPVRPPASGKAQLAIIVDDMGSSLQEARALADIGVPITFSIIPGLRQDREVAVFAASKKIEVMAHMPMQSKEYPQRRMEANGLLLSHDANELKRRVGEYLETLPQAVGANNHTGSAFTEDAVKMKAVLGILKQKGLFFIDSVTTPATTGYRIARELGIPGARRDVFLDNEQREAYILGQLAQAVARARKNGQAIAICHPHPTTIATLSKALPELKQQGITLVFASHLVR